MNAEQIKERQREKREKRFEIEQEKTAKKMAAAAAINTEYKAALSAIEQEIKELEDKLNIALVKEAEERNAGVYPVGTKLAEWEWSFEKQEKTNMSESPACPADSAWLRSAGRSAAKDVAPVGGVTMGHVPPPLAPRKAFGSDEEWYRYNMAELRSAMSQMPTLQSGLAIVAGVFLAVIAAAVLLHMLS